MTHMQAELTSFIPQAPPLDRGGGQSVTEAIARRAADADAGNIDLGQDIKALRDAGYLIAPLPAPAGGHDWGLASETARPLSDFLRALGRANLSVARLYEGHVNAVKLIWLYGTRRQQSDLFEKVRCGSAFLGVWGADGPEPVTILDEDHEDRTRLSGCKRFASGLGLVSNAIVTARWKEGSQLLVLGVDDPARMDPSTWRTAGMRATHSGSFDFNGMILDETSFIGSPNDYQREPHFEGGVWRYAAAHVGGMEALAETVRNAISERGQEDDPHQLERLARLAMLCEAGRRFVESAASGAEAKGAGEDTVAVVLLAREFVERSALEVMQIADRSLGTAAFLDGHPADRIRRDLGFFLRQAALDQKLMKAARIIGGHARPVGEQW
jgi:alkylation response protein AidB-like acyl-CoA dehydrogenase